MEKQDLINELEREKTSIEGMKAALDKKLLEIADKLSVFNNLEVKNAS